MANTKGAPHTNDKVVYFEAATGKLYDSEKERIENVVGQQIQAAREARGLSLVALKELLSQYGVSLHRTAIGKWESGTTVPNAYQLLALCHALGIEDGVSYFTREPKKKDELNIEGWDKLAEYKELLISSGRYRPTPHASGKLKIEHITMKVSMLPASAGLGEFLSEDSFEEVSFPVSAVPSGADFGIRVHGDSMEPVYHDGQIVWIKPCETLNPGEVGIFEYDECGYLKMYDEQEPDEDDLEYFTSSEGFVRMQPVLVSYNEEYAPIAVSPHSYFRIVGKVLN